MPPAIGNPTRDDLTTRPTHAARSDRITQRPSIKAFYLLAVVGVCRALPCSVFYFGRVFVHDPQQHFVEPNQLLSIFAFHDTDLVICLVTLVLNVTDPTLGVCSNVAFVC